MITKLIQRDMSKYHLYLNICFLVCVVISPPLLWETMFHNLFHIDKSFFFRDEVEIITSCIFTSAYILFPLFFIYQIVLKFKKKLSNVSFIMSLITFLIMILSITFYIILFRGLEEGKAKAHRESERMEIQNRKK